MRPGAVAVNVDPSDDSDPYETASEDSDYQDVQLSFMIQRDQPDGQQEQDSESPGGDPAPEPVDRPLIPT